MTVARRVAAANERIDVGARSSGVGGARRSRDGVGRAWQPSRDARFFEEISRPERWLKTSAPDHPDRHLDEAASGASTRRLLAMSPR